MRPLRLVLAAATLPLLVAWSPFDGMIFQPTPGADATLEHARLEGEEVFLTTEDGVRIHAFWVHTPGATRAVLFFHGNGGNASHRLPNAALLAAMDTHVLVAEYRGYGRSEGTPSEDGVYRDARAALAHLTQDREIPEDRIVVFGRSLGGGVAVDVAQDRGLAGVVLESTFTSITDVARAHYGSLAWILGRRFDSAAKIERVKAPLLFFHGDRDAIVPFALGRELHGLAPEPKAFVTLEGAGHNDTVQVGGPAYLERFQAFLDQVAPREAGPEASK